MVAPLSVPHGAMQTVPVDIIVKPRQRGINAAVERINGVEESGANVGNVTAEKMETVTSFITVGVFHVEEDGQFEKDARLVDNALAEMGFNNGVSGSECVGVMIRAADKPRVMSVMNVAGKRIIKAALAVTGSANSEINASVLDGKPVDEAIMLGNVNAFQEVFPLMAAKVKIPFGVSRRQDFFSLFLSGH